MDESVFPELLGRLAYHVPVLLVYLVALVLALVFMRRAALASTLTLAGVAILAVSSIAVSVIQMLLIHSRHDGGHSVAHLGRMLTVVGVAGSCLHAVGRSLLVAAIFVGRRPPSPPAP